MFQQKGPTLSPARKSQIRDSAVTILTSGCHFNGKLFCRGSSRIGGRVEGQLVSEGLLIIEEEAVINADIQAEEVIVQGQVSGTLVASERVEFAPSSQFDGELAAASLVIQEGAQFNGKCAMIQSAKAVPMNAPKADGEAPRVLQVPDVKVTQ